jgi:protein phosphatase
MEKVNIEIEKPVAFHELGQRANNEDSIFPTLNHVDSSNALFLVCDGVGGAEKGEMASQLVCQGISNFFNNHCQEMSDAEQVQKAIAEAQAQIDAYIAKHPDAKSMASTLTLLHLHKQGATVAHVGDSRVYHIRNGRILYKTHDHSLVNEWVSTGIITPEEAVNHPKKNVLVRAVVSSQVREVKADVEIITDLQPGDHFFLCTDGVLEHIDDETLCLILKQNISDQEKMNAIRDYGKDINQDNYSAYLVTLKKVIWNANKSSDNSSAASDDYENDRLKEQEKQKQPENNLSLISRFIKWFNF